MILKDYNDKKIVFHDSNTEIIIPPVEENGYYIFELYLYDKNGNKLKGYINNPEGGTYIEKGK